jgi:hypothetical protein
MITAGEIVEHDNGHHRFGRGRVVAIDLRSGTALVEWDRHRVERTTETLLSNRSYVLLASLRRFEAGDGHRMRNEVQP